MTFNINTLCIDMYTHVCYFISQVHSSPQTRPVFVMCLEGTIVILRGICFILCRNIYY